MSDYLKIKLDLRKRKYVFILQQMMEKSSTVKFSSSVQQLPLRLTSFTRPNLIYRLSEDAACTQKTLGDNGSLGTQKKMREPTLTFE